ncbi:MAG: Type A flavoprotein FprA [Candidatus Methanofastidiosum methylothiophilum]|uniref:Type A flavoprotein FprA n=1 Tax=Candidatus Methanofastidiosum methylothiophilum TaxID=1705564 RepID=A0A150IUU2_9EURY|nr:MAG: Type A flavoprotein FprA [Candidatus Methanofastidiosum methylthiophilus]KYC48743.1 MAG: Type A flavoprotein FprA [Candidatus Methanofastidiosum methylthiophilus]KYC51391.1 MAG: Type A flavoprotein FprA [Candidatus Methanofastidiosum methylthiophilus]
MKAFNFKEEIYWVGAVDWNPPDFSPCLTNGTTYNSYLIIDEKVALIDTVKHGFTQEIVSRINDVNNLGDIDYIIIGNYHMDHSGSLPFLMKKAVNATLVVTKKSKKAIEKYHGGNWKFKVVKDGDTLKLGKRMLLFKEFNLNGDKVLLTYSKHDKILFSGDLFSQHIASYSETDRNIQEIQNNALSYFVNYLMPIKSLPDISEIELLAPNHGIIFSQNTKMIIEKYQDWIKGKSKNKVLIIYSSVWRGTEKMAYAIAEGARNTGIEVEVINYEKKDVGHILSKIFESSSIAIGCPSFKKGIPIEISKLFYNIELIGLKKKSIALFTCYSDNNSPIGALMEVASKIDFRLIEKPLEVQYMPSESELIKCFELGNRLGERTKNNKE